MPEHRELPNLRHLRAFSLVAEHQSVKRAAAAIFLSQPAVTQAIGKLEAEFGVEFFVRSKTGMYCTAFGEALKARVDRALEKISTAAARPERKRRRETEDPIRFISSAHIKAIIAIADQGNFTLAARSLGISQPSMHRTARMLEQIVGQKLFIRSSQGVGLSPSGEHFARGAKLAAREVELAFEDIEFMRGQKIGRIAIGAMPLSRTRIVPMAVMRLLERYKYLQVSLIEGPYDSLLHGLRGGGIDMMVGALRQPAPASDVEERELFSDPLSVVVRVGHPLSRPRKVTLSDTIGYGWVIPREQTPTRDHFTSIFSSRALAQPKRLLEVSSFIAVRALLMESDRITLVSRHQIAFEEEAGLLQVLPIALPETRRAIGLTTRRDWKPTRPQRELIEEIEKSAMACDFDCAAARAEPRALPVAS